MANYYGHSRTNYFRVDPAKRAAFDAWTERFSLEVCASEDEDNTDLVCLLPGDYTDDGTFPRYDGETDTDFDFIATLAGFLAPGSVAVVQEVGAEKLRYLSGWAVAVDHTGKRVEVTLNDIYKRAADVFPSAQITRAEY